MKKIFVSIFTWLILGTLFLVFGKDVFLEKEKFSKISAPAQVKASSQIIQKANITILSYGFSPQVLIVKPGTEITWINKTGKGIGIDFKKDGEDKIYHQTELEKIKDGESRILVLNQIGVFKYFNRIHPEQICTIVVE